MPLIIVFRKFVARRVKQKLKFLIYFVPFSTVLVKMYVTLFLHWPKSYDTDNWKLCTYISIINFIFRISTGSFLFLNFLIFWLDILSNCHFYCSLKVVHFLKGFKKYVTIFWNFFKFFRAFLYLENISSLTGYIIFLSWDISIKKHFFINTYIIFVYY